MKTVVSSKGQIVLPAELRERDRVKPGQRFEIERVEEGRYMLTRQPAGDNDGLVEWLRGCPVKDWFVELDSESTDDL